MPKKRYVMSRLFWGATPVFSHGDRIALAAGSLTATEIDAITKQPGTDTFLPQLAPRLFLPSDIGHAATQKLSSEGTWCEMGTLFDG